MEIQSTARMTTPISRRWVLWVAVASLQILLMGAAFVGGRLLGEQNLRGTRSSFGMQLPSELPKDPMAGSGTVQKIQNDVITLTRGGLGGQSGQRGSGTSSQTEVTVTAETKYYKSTSSGGSGIPGAPSGGQTQIQVQEASLTDVKVGNMIMVWGPKSGERITAELIYIQPSGR